MMSSRVLLVTTYPLWAEVCCCALGRVLPGLEVVPLIATNSWGRQLDVVVGDGLDVVVISLDVPFIDLDSVRSLRALGYCGDVLIICSHFSLPSLEELMEANVQGVVSSLTTLDELAASISALAKGRLEPLLQQHLRATRSLIRSPLGGTLLNEREREVLQLVANDLTDQEIAARLHLSVRTVSNQLHQIYSKLGVKGRAGAVITAVTRGLIKLRA